MAELNKLREAADFLYKNKEYDLAYDIYDDITFKVWEAIGSAQSGIGEFSRNYLSGQFRNAIDFNAFYTEKVVSSLFLKWFGLDFEQLLIEFIFSYYGKVQCYQQSKLLRQRDTYDMVLSEYLILYTLILNNSDTKWVKQVTKFTTPVIQDNRLIKIRNNFTNNKLEENIGDLAPYIRDTEWAFLNNILLDYLRSTGKAASEFYSNLTLLKDKNYKSETHQESQGKQEKQYKAKYERYEKYEKYEKYERYEYSEFDTSNLTEVEKARFYGKVLNLRGKVSKSQIRKKYLELMSLYHPDKVESLGDELKGLAHKKTKEINEAYQWMKLKYNL